MGRQNSRTFDPTRYMNDDRTGRYEATATDGGRNLPRTYDLGPAENPPADALDDLKAGDRILFGDRSEPLTVAHMAEPNDPIGQSLTASVMKSVPDRSGQPEGLFQFEVGRDVSRGDVFLNPDHYGTPTGRRFAVVQGPRGGFYLLGENTRKSASRDLVLFRCVRSYHGTTRGHKGQGAWSYETNIERLELVEEGDAPDELDPGDDLPTFEEIADNTLLTYDTENDEIGHIPVGTVREAFEAGLSESISSALGSARARLDRITEDEDDSPEVEAERVEDRGRPEGDIHGTVSVTDVFMSEYGPKAVLETPAPWDVPDSVTPPNEVLKSTPWDETHRAFDPDREAWTIDLDELTTTAGVLSESGYAVVVETDLSAYE